MPARPHSLDRLLSTGRIRWAGSGAVARRAPAEWGYREVAGRFVEICGAGASANLTVAAGLVRDAQVDREPVAWITPPDSTFHPPDLADCGVDLEALAVVRPPDVPKSLRAADELLRSGAFGLVVLDGVGPRSIPITVQVRLANLAQQHDAAFLNLFRHEGGGEPGSSLASLRIVTFRRRVHGGAGEDAGFEYGFEAVKDKRRGRTWRWSARCEPPPGL